MDSYDLVVFVGVFALVRFGWIWNERDEKPLTRILVLLNVAYVAALAGWFVLIDRFTDRYGFTWGAALTVVVLVGMWLGRKWWRGKQQASEPAQEAGLNSAPRSQE